jgi:hypothetical protein
VPPTLLQATTDLLQAIVIRIAQYIWDQAERTLPELPSPPKRRKRDETVSDPGAQSAPAVLLIEAPPPAGQDVGGPEAAAATANAPQGAAAGPSAAGGGRYPNRRGSLAGNEAEGEGGSGLNGEGDEAGGSSDEEQETPRTRSRPRRQQNSVAPAPSQGIRAVSRARTPARQPRSRAASQPAAAFNRGAAGAAGGSCQRVTSQTRRLLRPKAQEVGSGAGGCCYIVKCWLALGVQVTNK